MSPTPTTTTTTTAGCFQHTGLDSADALRRRMVVGTVGTVGTVAVAGRRARVPTSSA
ncbi:MAG TPA: hypothetical protein VGF99_10455 [Myxococcota bacterium]